MGLRDIKIPKLKFGKFKMKEAEDIASIKAEYEKEKNEVAPIKKRNKPYEGTNYETIKECFTESCSKYGDNVAVLEKPDVKTPYKEITYKEFHDDVWALGTAMIKLLNQRDKRVVIVGETQYGWYVSYMAMLCGVGIAVPVDRELPENELENCIKRARATAVIYSPRKADSIKALKKKLKSVEYFIEMKSDAPLKGRDVGINYLIENGKNILKSGDDTYEKIKINPDEFKVLIFTSGTTSNSKGVMISNRNLAANINGITPYVRIYPSDRLFSVLPLHHTYESTIGFLYPISQGASIAICQGLRYILQNLQEAKPTAVLVVPLLAETIHKKITDSIRKSHKEKLVQSMILMTNLMRNVGIDIKKKVFKEIYDNLGGNLRILVSAAAPIDPKAGKWFDDIGILFLQGYGLTETAPITAVTPEYKINIGSAGRAIIQADVKVDRPNEKGEGEILIKSPTLMLGYYENEEETKKVMTEDGYFRSGDIGYIDDDNFIYITGRSKNVIVTQNGKNIYPEEIETMIGKIPEVQDVMVYGKEPEKDDTKKADQELIITAMVTINKDEVERIHGKDISQDEVKEIIWQQIKDVNKKLTSYKAVKALEIKEGEFEKTSTMKIKRYKELNKDKKEDNKEDKKEIKKTETKKTEKKTDKKKETKTTKTTKTTKKKTTKSK